MRAFDRLQTMVDHSWFRVVNRALNSINVKSIPSKGVWTQLLWIRIVVVDA